MAAAPTNMRARFSAATSLLLRARACSRAHEKELASDNSVRETDFAIKNSTLDEKMPMTMFVEEYMPNRNLFEIIDGSSQQLDWYSLHSSIFRIAHLNAKRVIHADLKPANILLDSHMNHKISDFGMSRILVSEVTETSTQELMGSACYMLAEYIRKRLVQAMANPAIDDGDSFVLDSGAATGYHASLFSADDDAGVTLDNVLCFSDDDITANNIVHFSVELDEFMEKSRSDDATAHRYANLSPQLTHHDELAPVISEKISMVSRPGNGGSGSERAAWQSDVHHSGADSCTVDEHGAATTTENGTAATWLLATAAPHHATGNRGLLSGFTPELGLLFVQPAGGDGAPMPIRGRGAVATGAVVLPDVWFVPGLAANLVSVSQLAGLGYSVGFARGVCSVRSDGGAVVAGEARVGEDGLFALDFLRIPLDAI